MTSYAKRKASKKNAKLGGWPKGRKRGKPVITVCPTCGKRRRIIKGRGVCSHCAAANESQILGHPIVTTILDIAGRKPANEKGQP